ncbi:hypothetical protein P879_11661 [Paragonimus westermani]|uniref:Uncharacterized protein n=1 Tax=Paragonimus westermani TaxID=34504 RepID=A0A8T0D4B8_9TREM|nr:hypothetical protein P879_11661 [Paragonimus westermani]
MLHPPYLLLQCFALSLSLARSALLPMEHLDNTKDVFWDNGGQNLTHGATVVMGSPTWLSFPGGEHGYDPEFSDMSPFLLASGPGFLPVNESHTIPSIKMVDLYPMMCHLLGLHNPGPHNGSLARVAHLLQPHNNNAHSWFTSPWDAFTRMLINTFNPYHFLFYSIDVSLVLLLFDIVFGAISSCPLLLTMIQRRCFY